MRYEEYPKGDDGEALDTPVWRNADNIKDTASSKDSVLIKAIREWDTDPAQLTAALAAGEDINGLDRFGFTAIMLAVKSKQPKLIELLLAVEGIQLDVQTKRGFSALMIAAWKGDDKTVEKLLVKGAKIELKDGGKRNAWGIAHDWHNESTLELLGKHGLTYTSYGGTTVAVPPAPKWRPDEKWD